jgi:hypothetical protein
VGEAFELAGRGNGSLTYLFGPRFENDVNLPDFSWYGLVAWVILLAGIFSSIRGFSGMKKERYSLLNHFVSELGDPRFAKHKTRFAVALISSGILLVPFVVGLGLRFDSLMGNVLVGFGIFSAVSCILVGFVPEDKVKTHFIVAGGFFIGIMLLMLLFAITLILQPMPAFPPWVIGASFGAFALILTFLIHTVSLPKWELERTNEPWAWDDGRPKFWLNPFLEWCAFFAMFGWLFMVVILSF